MEIIGGIICIILEALFIFLCIRAMKDDKLSLIRNILFLFGIIAANLISGILHMSVFRYLLTVGLTLLVIRVIYKHVKFYDIYALFIAWAVKITFEILSVVIIFRALDGTTVWHGALCGAIFLLMPILLRVPISKAYKALELAWSRSQAFYLRYALGIVFILSILLYLRGLTEFAKGVQ